jgi:hypothetical protein
LIHIGGLQVQDSWTEYAVEVNDGAVVECDDLAEVELICANDSSVKPLKRRCYLTEWEVLDNLE